MTNLNRHDGTFVWRESEILNYKETGTNFKNITRQILYPGTPELPSQMRYFEIGPGGYSSLERHVHEHVVMVIRGEGRALVGTEILTVRLFDVVRIPSRAWHQFRAGDAAIGFICLVNIERDRPEHPNAAQITELKSNPNVASFIRI